jgi:hypothetical protein
MINFQVVPNVKDVIASKILRLEEVCMLYQRKEGVANLLWDVVPVIPLRGESMV